MTREHVKQLLPILTAFAEGKEIQINISTGEWVDMLDEAEFKGKGYLYRIKPPTPHYRPWKTEEVPIACKFKHKSSPNFFYFPCTIDERGICVTYKPLGSTNYPFESALIPFNILFTQHEYTIDNKTWLPCGVLVEEKRES